MNDYSFRKNQAPDPLPYILLGGLLAGIVLSWILFKQRSPAVQPTPSATPVYRSSPSITSTPTSLTVIEITPIGTRDAAAAPPSTAGVGQPAPDFSLKTIDGKDFRLSSLKGKAVLINLWASWCPPCRYEMPAIQAAYQKYKDKGLMVLAINFTAQDNLQDAAAFVAEFGLTFPILLDETGDVSIGLYGVRGLPTSYFIDTGGVIQHIQVGAMLPEKLEGYLAAILPK